MMEPITIPAMTGHLAQCQYDVIDLKGGKNIGYALAVGLGHARIPAAKRVFDIVDCVRHLTPRSSSRRPSAAIRVGSSNCEYGCM